MPESSRPAPDAVLAAAAAEFLASARGALDAFDVVARDLAAQHGSGELLTVFRRELHRLSGSSATFGYPRAGRMAAAMEAVVKKWIDDPDLDRHRRADVVAGFARTIRERFATAREVARVPGRRLLIVGVRDAVGVPLTAEAAARGYLVERVAVDDLEEALEDGAPFAMIAAAPAPEHELLRATVTIELYADAPAGPAADSPGRRCLAVSTAPADVMDAIEIGATAERQAAGCVLVVDDDPVIRAVVGVAAAQVNLGVSEADAPDAFRAALARIRPSVVVIDIEIGAVSGVDLVRELRAQAAYATVPVLVLSGHRDEETRRSALDAGASDYLLKPVSLPLLAAKLAAWHARGGA